MGLGLVGSGVSVCWEIYQKSLLAAQNQTHICSQGDTPSFFDLKILELVTPTYLIYVAIVPGEGQDFIPKYFVGKFDLHQRTYAIMEIFLNATENSCSTQYITSVRIFYLVVASTVKSLRHLCFRK